MKMISFDTTKFIAWDWLNRHLEWWKQDTHTNISKNRIDGKKRVNCFTFWVFLKVLVPLRKKVVLLYLKWPYPLYVRSFQGKSFYTFLSKIILYNDKFDISIRILHSSMKVANTVLNGSQCISWLDGTQGAVLRSGPTLW